MHKNSDVVCLEDGDVVCYKVLQTESAVYIAQLTYCNSMSQIWMQSIGFILDFPKQIPSRALRNLSA